MMGVLVGVGARGGGGRLRVVPLPILGGQLQKAECNCRKPMAYLAPSVVLREGLDHAVPVLVVRIILDNEGEGLGGLRRLLDNGGDVARMGGRRVDVHPRDLDGKVPRDMKEVATFFIILALSVLALTAKRKATRACPGRTPNMHRTGKWRSAATHTKCRRKLVM